MGMIRDGYDRLFGGGRASGPWQSKEPIREELFGIERLELHATTLAKAQPVTATPVSVPSLHQRLKANETVLSRAYRSSAAELELGHELTHAAEWFLDNYHLVEAQLYEIRSSLPGGYYRQLPKLAAGPFAGYPRVFGIAWAFIAHNDSHFDPEILSRFILAYQRVQPLTIGELWAVPITLRIVLIENLRRLVEQITLAQQIRADADALCTRLLVEGCADSALSEDIASRASGPLSELFAAQLVKQLRDQDPNTTPALGWLEARLTRQGVSVEEVVLHAQQRQGASNVTIRNVITSMRLISGMDWNELVEGMSLVDHRLRAESRFAEMDFPTRNLYRQAIEQLARYSDQDELAVTARVLTATRLPSGQEQDEIRRRAEDPGYHLIAEGRPALEAALGFRPPLRLRLHRFYARLGIQGYIGIIALLTLLLLALSHALLVSPDEPGPLWLFLLFAILPANAVALALVNYLISCRLVPRPLPAMDLSHGIPSSLRTLVVMPTLLVSPSELLAQIEQLEVHHLSGVGGDLSFALLSDGVDAQQERLPGDEALLAVARQAIARLNEKYGPGPSGDRFWLLHRHRRFNPGEGCWMGWERKRGKLCELNRLLRGATDTSFMAMDGEPPAIPQGVRYVITLDADTRLPRDAASRLIGKMAHPLNHAHLDAGHQRVTHGYGILQPRVTPSLPLGQDGSYYQRLYSGPGGMDPYAATVSDIYQDLFGEGSFTGKGIYDVDAFSAALAGRVPDNRHLSHDLFEGIFARAGLASDIEVVEEFPSRYDVSAKRQHRWTRGDWQLLAWICQRQRGQEALPLIGRWKMFDNLCRSLLAPSTLLALLVGWQLPLAAAALASLLLLATLALPIFLPLVVTLIPRKREILWRHYLGMVGQHLQRAFMQALLSLVFLTDQTWRMTDAIVRTLFRLNLSHRHLLEWTTSAQSSGSPRLSCAGFYRLMAAGVALGLGVCTLTLLSVPAVWPLVLPVGLLWLLAPLAAYWTSRPRYLTRQRRCPPADAAALRLVARQTWRYFETFVTDLDNQLPPDNFQESPLEVIAHRTSPTNMGLYLLSILAANDFGWAGRGATLKRLEDTLAVMQRLPRFRGHFFNWYDTRSLLTLEPAYVSSVDSGNLAGHLLVVATGCERWQREGNDGAICSGILDTCRLAQEALQAYATGEGAPAQGLAACLKEIRGQLARPLSATHLLPVLARLTAQACATAHHMGLNEDPIAGGDLLFWLEALKRVVAEHLQDQAAAPDMRQRRLQALALQARSLAMGMDFSFLLNGERKLLSIGYSLSDNRLDGSCYDLLASEARLASLFAIAKGDVVTNHWFRLGRAATPLGAGAALISWSGSMFEYLMPSLVMRAPIGSQLEQTNRLIVDAQIHYGRALGIPWGISESAYNARDMEFTYQYSNFGLPQLALKRGLAEDRVVAPYATGLAAMVNPGAALANFQRLAAMGGCGRYGFYEALDFTPSRLPDNQQVAVVQNYMAHHQGMTIVALANALLGGLMRARFHEDPIIQACELLLQERIPQDMAIVRPHAAEIKASLTQSGFEVSSVRRLPASRQGAPVTHLLSNGRYSVMVTGAGAGYSRWGNIAITRWQEDATRDHWGSFLFLHDLQSGETWSPSAHPLGSSDPKGEVIFAEDRAQFIHHQDRLTTTLEVLVSGETDGEVRRISLSNRGRSLRHIELTSYAEVVLTTPEADRAHPAFSKLFVVTEYLAELGALIATRRPRAPEEKAIWAAHFIMVEEQADGPLQYESDRALFIGQGRTLASAHALQPKVSLSNTTGTVLDPIFSLRQRVQVLPGGSTHVAFWTLVASSRSALLDLIDQHHNRHAFQRAKTLAWTQAQVQLHHLNIQPSDGANFQRLAAPLLYADARFRAPSRTIGDGLMRQSALWQQSISGDLPIMLLHIDDVEDLAQVHELLLAHEYLRMKRLAVDLVIMNEHASTYVQDLQNGIDTAVRSSQSRPRFHSELAQGSVYTVRRDLMSGELCELLYAAARVVLTARRGTLQEQLARLKEPPLHAPLAAPPRARHAGAIKHAHHPELECFNGLGGFAREGREYVTLLSGEQTTPAPWLNVIANPGFGFQASAQGSGYTWADNSKENQLTPWSNDPVTDPVGEAIYIRDEETRALWSPTAQPIRDGGQYVARHGFGYSRFEHQAHGIHSELLQYVPVADPVKISRLTLHNLTNTPRRLAITCYAEWVLGPSRAVSAPFITTRIDERTGAMLARNPWNGAFPERVAFLDLGGRQTSWTGDRSEFIGYQGQLAAPAALLGDHPLSGSTGAGMDPCSALQTHVELAPGQRLEILVLLGQGASAEQAAELILRYRQDLDEVLEQVEGQWRGLLGAVQVKTPDRAMDIMLNGWLLYQTLACRIWARSAFYQAGGAYGFRDQLQDGMALGFAAPEATRQHLLRAAARQFVEGDMQHWWLPHSGLGVRTRISDDRVWLALATATYVRSSADDGILEERIPFLDGPPLGPDQQDAFFLPQVGEEVASLYEHCARALDQAMALTGSLGLPLMGSGDWNDGMNRVGSGGKGESVWLGWLLLRTIALFAPLARARHDDRAERWLAHAERVGAALEQTAWDGAWYRRATFDDGSWLGSNESHECQIDAIAQSWAVLSGAADPVRARMAMQSLAHHLIRDDEGLCLLFRPPFDTLTQDPGYIRGYPPGLRENGGQYTHAAVWAILAFARLEEADKAHGLFNLLNPIHHARDPAAVERYKVEPYVMAADIYSVAPHTGRGGWTWYTGAAGWMYQAGLEGILGIRREGEWLLIDPALPTHWPGYRVEIALAECQIIIEVSAEPLCEQAAGTVRLDGVLQPPRGYPLRVPLHGQHRVEIILGE
ncbi:GH36-type glycosyl hydrolase domain-containing protein [Aeromonas bivalvium]|uniref:GH36-type glycosyl hydrolase domain-containing protein n=1 Tax=Aeromonas bivalvium TaxID=440079 RepID=UPI0038D01CB3